MMDVEKVKPLINEKVKAIIPVHLFGHPVDMDALLELAEEHDLLVVEDAAQAHGAECRGRRIGSLGDCACFSFYPSKNLGAYGDGGLVVTNDRQIYERIRLLRQYGEVEKNKHVLIGYNSRLDELQAAVLRVKLKYLDKWISDRRKVAAKYRRALDDLEKIVLPMEREYAKHVYHLFVIRSQKRDDLQKWLSKRGVGVGIHYPTPVHLQKSYEHLNVREGSLPMTERYSKEMLSLPMFPEMTDDEIEYVCECIRDFHREG
jgi:dTDP-4-amino-4,6-dideoxygalactose transaminase